MLDNIDMLFILKELYGSIIITQEVFEEFGKTVPDWINVREVETRFRKSPYSRGKNPE